MPSFYREPLEELLPLFQVFDGMLERSLSLVDQELGNQHREQAISEIEGQTALKTEFENPPSYPLYSPADSVDLPSSQAAPASRFGTLRGHFGLSAFDVDVMIIALAPELDPRYEEIYAFLQKDVKSRRPSVNLALNLLCKNAVDKIQRRSHFAPASPLINGYLVKLTTPPHLAQPTLLSHEIILEPAVVRYLLAEQGIDVTMKAFASLNSTPIDQLSTPNPSQEDAWLKALTSTKDGDHRLHLYLQSRDWARVNDFVQRLGNRLGRAILRIDLVSLLKESDPEDGLRRSLRDAWLQNTILHIQPLGMLTREASPALQSIFWHLLSVEKVPTVLSGQQTWQSLSPNNFTVIQLVLPDLTPTERYDLWQNRLSSSQISVDEATLLMLAHQFRLTAIQIEQAIADTEIALQHGIESQSAEVLLLNAVRSQCSQALQGLTQPIQPRYQWNDLVLPPGQTEQLQEICIHMQRRYRVLEEWGFDRKLSLGKGISTLFSGPPGTGKTMAAEVIATTLKLDLYRIDLSQVVSKYIGETEKNLGQIFAAAANANAILLFDEADSLFGKRTEIKDAHDRFANIEVGYLLQQIEAYEGLAILTTNLRSNLDEAFIRRLRFIVEFPLPTVSDRVRIWQKTWPPELPLADHVDWQALAEQLDITGGNIRNIALSAAFLAAAEDTVVNLSHIKRAARREYQKMGKLLMDKTILTLP